MSKAVCDQPLVGLIERPEPTCEADLGLTPMTMASFVRSKLIGAGGLIRFLDICAFTVHGTKACACGGANVSSPVAGLFPHRSTPELRHLQVK